MAKIMPAALTMHDRNQYFVLRGVPIECFETFRNKALRAVTRL